MSSIQIQAIGDDALESFVAFWLGAQARPADIGQKIAKFRWMYERHCQLVDDVPFGWVAMHEDSMVAGKLCLATEIGCGSRRQIALMSSSFRVLPEFGGVAALLFKQFMSQGQRFPLFATSANAQSARLWSAFRATPIAGSETEWLYVGRSRAGMEERWFARTGKARIAQLLSLFAAQTRLVGPDVITHQPLQREPSDVTWEVVQSPAYLDWRIGRAPEPRPHCVMHGEQPLVLCGGIAGHRHQLNVTRILGWKGSPTSWLEEACRWADRSDGLAATFVAPDDASSFAEAGFVERKLEAPLAWLLDNAQILGGRPLRLLALDSDLYA